MNAIQQFNGLNGQTNISRQTLQELVEQAKKENATVIIYRISKILNDFPDEEYFDISLKQYPEPPQGLNGAMHTGSYEEALDECGRLRKGWFFQNGYIYQIKDNKKIRHEKGGRLDIKNSNKTEKEEQKKNSHSAENQENKEEKKEKEKKQTEKHQQEEKETEKKYTTDYFKKDLDYEKLCAAYRWSSFSPDKKAKGDIDEWAISMVSLYEAYIEEAQKNQVQEKYNATFDKWHKNLLTLKEEITGQYFKIISVAVAGGAGVKQSQIRKNESAWKNINELSNSLLSTWEKAKKELQKIAKNIPENQYISGEAIKSTDKFADDKIQQKIQTLQASVERIKKIEKELKKSSENQWKTILINSGFTEKEADFAIKHKQDYGVFYLGKSTTNLNAEIRRLKKRLEDRKIKTTNQENKEDKVTEFEGGKIVQNTEEMRLQIHFDEVPSAEIREALKKKAFKWSPKNKVWQRVLTRDAISAIDGLFKKEEKAEKIGLNAPQLALTTEDFKKMSVKELRAFTLQYYNENLKGKTAIIKKYLKEVVFTSQAGRKIAKGEAMYSAKAVAVQYLQELIENSTYNNWGDRKASDSKDVLGYLNFKSKLTIDGEKRHLRISFIVDEKRKVKFKTFEIGSKPKKESRTTPMQPPAVSCSREVIRLSDHKNTKKTETTKEKTEKSGLNGGVPEQTNTKALSYIIKNKPTEWNFFQIDDPELALFLGKLERKTTDSLAVTIAGEQGSGKTTFVFRLINELAKHYKVAHVSNEESPDSYLYFEKAEKYFTPDVLQNIEPYDVRNFAELAPIIERNEVIVVDSFQKIRELYSKFQLDKDLRKKYNGKLFVLIYQLTSDGKMKGGSSSGFDGDTILFTKKMPRFEDNYVYPDKNRYTIAPLHELKYNIFTGELVKEELEITM